MPLNAYFLSFWNDPWEASTAASKHKFVKNHCLTTSCQTTLQQGSGLHMTANGWSQQGLAKPRGQHICCRPELLCLFSDRIEAHKGHKAFIIHPHTKTAQYVQKHGGKTLSLKHGSLTTASTPQWNAQPKEYITWVSCEHIPCPT